MSVSGHGLLTFNHFCTIFIQNLIVNKPLPDRIITYSEREETIIEIPPLKTLYLHYFFFIWCTFWAYGLYNTLELLLNAKELDIAIVFIFFWCIVWIFMGILVGYAFYWHSFGVELITLGKSHITIKKGVLGKKKTFRYDHIDRIRLLDASTGVFPLNPYGGHITLTCAGIQFIFAKHVNHHEAAYIHEKLLSHLNQ